MFFPATEQKQSQQPPLRWTLRDAATVVMSIICLILALNIGIILTDLKEVFLKSEYKSLITLGLFLLQEAIFISPLYFLVIKKYRVKTAEIGFRTVGFWQSVKWVLKGYGLVILFNIFLIFLMSRIGYVLPGFQGQTSHIPMFGGSAFDIAIAVFVLVIIAPVIEEIFFRGFLLQAFLQKFRPAAASALTAVLFTAIHLEFQSAGIIIFLALVMNWIFIRTKSLWPCIAFHAINNAIAFTVEWLVWAGYLQV